MHTLWLTSRLLSRALWNGIANLSIAADPNLHKRNELHLVSAVCGFSKENTRTQRLINGQFGDDAWFVQRTKSSDILGQYLIKIINILLTYLHFFIF